MFPGFAASTAMKRPPTEIRFPAWPAKRRSGFCEFARRRDDFALAGVAVFFDDDDGQAGKTLIGVMVERALRSALV